MSLQVIASLALFFNSSKADDLMDIGIAEDQSILESVDIKSIIKGKGWSIEGAEMIPTGRAIVFKKEGNILGYCIIERERVSCDVTKSLVSRTTKIAFGDSYIPPNGDYSFTINDPGEIALWVAICQNHMQTIKYKIRLFALSSEAQFKNASIDIKAVLGRGDHRGLHFFDKDEDIIIFGASTDELNRGEFNCNPILMSMVSAKIQKLKNQQQK